MNKLLALADGAMLVAHQQHQLSQLGYRKRDKQLDLKKDNHNLHTLSCFGLPYQDHNYGAPPPPTPPQSPPHIIEEPVVTVVESSPERPEETPETDPPCDLKKEGETSEEEREEDDDESNQDEGITRCICDFEHDDGYMICCDKCLVWQHVECMGLDRSNIPDNYFCEQCQPRLVDIETAKILQSKKKKHLEDLQRREDLENRGRAAAGSPKAKKKLKKKKKKKEKNRDDEHKKKDKKKKKRDRERGDSTTSNENAGSDDNRSEENESDSAALDDSSSSKEPSLIQCTPELEKVMDEYRKNPEMFLAGAATYHGSREEINRTKVCIGQVGKGDVNGVVSLEQIPANQPIMQLSGTLSLLDEKRKGKPLDSFMFLYSSFCNTELVLNAGGHDNKARFTRKSCSPNAEIRHMIVDGEVQLYTFALKDISSNAEVTLGIDFDFTLGQHPVKCACGKKSCPVKKFWQKQKTNGIKHKNNNSGEVNNSPAKKTVSPLRLSLNKQISQETPNKGNEGTKPTESKSEPATPRGKPETTTAETKPLHKMTREERKMDAIMKAFERMEKTQQRRQQTMERLAKEKPTTTTKTVLEPEQEQQQQEEQVKDQGPEKTEKKVEIAEKLEDVAASEKEEVKVPPAEIKPKPRVQRKRRRTSSRRRSRNSSGASTVSIEVSSPDDESAPVTQTSCPSMPVINTEAPTRTAAPVTTYATTVTPSVISSSTNLLSVQTNNLSENKSEPPQASPAANSKHFKFPKTKRFFMNEWLNEKAQEASADSPLTVKTENFDSSTINSPNAAAPRERTTSLDVSFGSAKKRWLRQAMQETSQPGSNGSNSPVCNGGASPVTPSPAVSPNSNSSDFMTPLKKRLLRHSLSEERPSLKSELSSEDSSSIDQQPLLTITEEHSDEEMRKNSSLDSGLSVTTPADLETLPKFPAVNSSPGEQGAAEKNESDKIEGESQGKGQLKTIPALDQVTTKEEPSIKSNPVTTASSIAITDTVTCSTAVTAGTAIASNTSHIISKSLKRCLSDEASFSNGEINPAYFSPKKRHLYLRQNTDPSTPPLGASWPRQEVTKGTPGDNSGSLSQSWSVGTPQPEESKTLPSATPASHPPGSSMPVPGTAAVMSPAHAGAPPQTVPAAGGPPGTSPPGCGAQGYAPGPPEMMAYQNYPQQQQPHPSQQPMEGYLTSPKPAASVSAPTTPSKKRVSLLEYRKRKSVSATKRPPEKDAPAEESKDASPEVISVESSPTSSTTAESTPDKATPTKPANVITFKDKKFPMVIPPDNAAMDGGLQSLPLFRRAPIAEVEEGKKLTLTAEAHKLITSLTQVLKEGNPEKPKPRVLGSNATNEDPLQRMRRELNEKNKEKDMALKRAHSPEPPPPPPEKKMRAEVRSPPIPPPPPPRNAPPHSQALHSPKGGSLKLAVNHVVVNPPGFPAVPQVVPQTNGGHMVYPAVVAGSTPASQYPQQPMTANHSPRVPQQQITTNHSSRVPQQPITTNHSPHVPQQQQIAANHSPRVPQQPVTANHSPRGTPLPVVAANHSPRGSQQPIANKHSPRAHYSPVSASTSPRGSRPHPNSFQYNNHTEEPSMPVPNQSPYPISYNNGGDQRYHVNGGGGGGRKISPNSYSKYQASSVHDKRSSSYNRNNLSPRRYQRL